MPFQYDFSRIHDRRGTRSIKWDLAQDETLPMWVADMDFAAPPPVVDALTRRLEHPLFGYTLPDAEYNAAFVDWQRTRNAWEIEKSWLLPAPGTMPLVSLCVETLIPPGAGIVVPVPVYYPFYRAIEGHGRRVLRAPLTIEGGRYRLDLGTVEALAGDAQMLLLCSPHNPGGRVWTRDELSSLAAIAERHDLVVIADEIHGDLTYPGHRFVPFGSVHGAGRYVAIHAPNKTFNTAGISSSTAIVPDPELRKTIDAALETHMLRLPNALAQEAAIAAYRHGAPWLDQLRAYLSDNAAYIREACATTIPGVVPLCQEGTFIQWIDFRTSWTDHGSKPLPGNASTAFDAHCRASGLWLSSGSAFGPEGNGFMRLNFGCPRAVLEEGISRLARAVESFVPDAP